MPIHLKTIKSASFLSIYTILITLVSCKAPQEETFSETDIFKLRTLYSSGDPNIWPKPHLDSKIDMAHFQDIGVLPKVIFPQNNSYTKAKAILGKLLFFDPRLSRSSQIACASCHNPELSWTDQITKSFGHNRQIGKRNAMTILNTAYAQSLFWDGRAESLEDQVRFPIPDPLEMDQELSVAVEEIAALKGYIPYFEAAFGDPTVSLTRIKKAIATFERTIVSPKSKFDRFIEGADQLFSDQEVLGLHLFRTKAQCINCHNGPYFSDNQFHNDGQTLWGSKNEDLGRYHITQNIEDIGKFKTPTLREVSRTGPWMHHGNFPTLTDVIQFYNLGNPSPIQKKYLGTPRDSMLPVNSGLLGPLTLTDTEVNALIAFIETLTTPVRRIRAPKLPKK